MDDEEPAEAVTEIEGAEQEQDGADTAAGTCQTTDPPQDCGVTSEPEPTAEASGGTLAGAMNNTPPIKIRG